MTGISKAVTLWMLWETTAIFPLAPTRTCCDRDSQKKRPWKQAYPACQESSLHPTPPQTYTLSPTEAFIKKWQVLGAEWDLNLD